MSLNLASVIFKALWIALAILVARAVVWLINLLLIAPAFDPLRRLPGPEGTFFQTHIKEVTDPDLTPDTHQDWTREHGKTFRFQGFGRHDYRLMSLDLRVISHVLNSPIYEKPWQTRHLLGSLLGDSIFTVEGPTHKIQRKIIGPAFTTPAIQALTPVFFQTAEELAVRWNTLIEASQVQETDCEAATIDISHWISRATFDSFGTAALGYYFHALREESEKLYLAYRDMFNLVDKKKLLYILFPMLEKIWPDETTKATKKCLDVVREAGKNLISAKKAVILSEKADSSEIQEKDLLSLLIKSNLCNDPVRRLTDSDLLDQLSSFLFAGSDSTALAISWCLHYLSINPSIQTRLREEIMLAKQKADASDSPDAIQDSIMASPLLTAVVREALRLCPPVHATIRVATADDCIPISSPVVLRSGQIIQKDEYIHIRKGSYIHIPIEGLNYDSSVWGPDARQFNPDRWLSLSPPNYPGLANVMTFSSGFRGCPGYKFTIDEMKAFIATLLPQFEFKPVPEQTVGKCNGILTRPFVKGQLRSGGFQLPVLVARYDNH